MSIKNNTDNKKEKKFMIIKDRVETYKDFTLNLLYNVNHYYLDDDCLSKDIDINNHFSFCFNKVCDNFLLEGIDFKKNTELKEYFRHYYYHRFYKAQSNPDMDTSLKYYENFWSNIFNVEKLKNKNIIRIFVEIYRIFDISISKNENILDII